MERALALLGVAVAAALLLRPEGLEASVDRAIRKGGCVKPLKKIVVKRRPIPAQDNSNTSYAALGIRPGGTPWPPPATPGWLWNPVWRLGQAWGAIQKLKDDCRKGIVAALDRK